MKNECPECGHTWETAIASASVKAGEIGRLLDLIVDSELNDYESGFISSLRPRFAQYGDNTHMSVKQMAILRKIAAK